jgi:hypothetical protein
MPGVEARRSCRGLSEKLDIFAHAMSVYTVSNVV